MVRATDSSSTGFSHGHMFEALLRELRSFVLDHPFSKSYVPARRCRIRPQLTEKPSLDKASRSADSN